MRIALIANAASGGGLDPEELAERMRRHGADVRAFGVEPDQLEPAAAWGPERVAVAGGDGTLGTAAALAGRLGVPLAVIPTGTANDYARASALPDDPEDACALAATGMALSLSARSCIRCSASTASGWSMAPPVRSLFR